MMRVRHGAFAALILLPLLAFRALPAATVTITSPLAFATVAGETRIDATTDVAVGQVTYEIRAIDSSLICQCLAIGGGPPGATEIGRASCRERV